MIDGGVVSELDGTPRERFDTLDRFIADHGIDLGDRAPRRWRSTDLELAQHAGRRRRAPRRARAAVARPARRPSWRGSSAQLDPVEMMFALKSLRARRQPANQAHVTNSRRARRCSPPTPPRRRCAASPRCETTVGVARYAPLNALAHPGRRADRARRRDDPVRGRGAPQPAAGDAAASDLRRDALGVRHRARRSSTATTRPGRRPSSASAYASRGVKVRFTSGTGSEALMGHAEGCSMLYLEARCLAVMRAARHRRACRTAPSRASR